MPSTRSKGKSAIGMDSRIDRIESQLKDGLSQLRKSIGGEKVTSGEDRVDVQRAISEFEDAMNSSLSSLRLEVLEFKNMILKETETFHRKSHESCVLVTGLKHAAKEDLYKEVCSNLSTMLGMSVTKSDINNCYRLGRKTGGGDAKPRPVVVDFVHQWRRDQVFAEKRRLKGSGLVMYEMLTNSRLQLFRKVKEKLGFKSCWTWRGNIYACINNVRRRIEHENEIPANNH